MKVHLVVATALTAIAAAKSPTVSNPQTMNGVLDDINIIGIYERVYLFT